MENSLWIEIYGSSGETVDMIKVHSNSDDNLDDIIKAFEHWCKTNNKNPEDYDWDYSSWRDDIPVD